MQKRWVIKREAERDVITQLIEDLGVSKPIANILSQRGIRTFKEAKDFFRPDPNKLHDPFLMKGMDEAVGRIEKAIASGENILIYGDYDVDGTTAVALLYSYLRRDYEQIGYYIPDRYKEGYGISDAGIDFSIENSFDLVIALDCGIKAVNEIKKAKENGVDFIVCDHHTPGEEIPDAIILNPKQEGCTYPFKELSGCGIGFKVAQALNHLRGKKMVDIVELLDLVVLSIGADVVSMSGENRILAASGLARINDRPRIGFEKLLEYSKKQGTLNVQDLIFSLAPRINAAGRIDSGKQAVQLLLAKTDEEVDQVSNLINVHNETRKGLDREITAEALEIMREDEWMLNAKSTVLFKENWHKGVVGIVASRIMETYYRPTVVLTESNGKAVGSARSVKGFNIYEAIDHCSDLLEQYGGHFYAAGMTMPLENLVPFKMKFDQFVSQNITEKQLVPEIEIDCELEFRDIFENQIGGIPKFYRILRQLSPFGPDNPIPTFVSRNVRDTGNSRVLKEEHLKLSLVQEEYPEIILNGIAFGMAGWYPKIKDTSFDIVYTIQENHWQGTSTLQLMVQDIRLSELPT